MQENLQDFWNTIVKEAGSFTPKLAGAIFTLIIGWWVIGLITKTTKRLLDRSNIEPSLKTFAISLLNIGLKIMLLISAAGVLGIDTNSFVAILGAASLAVGFALQGSLSNFAGGVMILFFKPFKVGDLVEAQGFKGVVQEIQIFTTVLAAPGGKKIIVPNAQLSNGTITNFSSKEGVVLDLTFGIGYDDDIDKAKRIIKEVVDSCPHINKQSNTQIFVSELADSSVNFLVRSGVTVATYWDAYFFMHENIKKAFDRERIGIPYPQMDVHVHKN